jgi:hypothetical protein
MEKETTYLVLAALALYVISRKQPARYPAAPQMGSSRSDFLGTGSSLTDIIKTASEAYRAYDRQEWEQSYAEKRDAAAASGTPTTTPDKPAA